MLAWATSGVAGLPPSPPVLEPNTSMPEVSVVIPSYNHAPFIEAALSSVSRQSFRDLDVVIVDDGSTDESVSIVRRFSETSDLTINLIQQTNAGAHAALDRGIQASTGRVIAILNSDDVYHPERLEVMLAEVPKHTHFIAFSEFGFIDGTGQLIPDDPHNIWYREALADNTYMPSLGFMFIKSNITVSTSNLLFSRSLYGEVGSFRAWKTAHDLDFLLRCVVEVEPIFVRRTLLQYRIHDKNTINRSRDLERLEVRAILDQYTEHVAKRPPRNPRSPGARQMPLYSEYVLLTRPHWSGSVQEEARLALRPALDLTPTISDARAFRLEVERLGADLLRETSREREVAQTAALAKTELAATRSALAEAREQLIALRASTSWRLTRPVRMLGRVYQSLLGRRSRA